MKKLAFVVIGVLAVVGLLMAFDGDCKEFTGGKRHPMQERNLNNARNLGMMKDMSGQYEMICEQLELTEKQKEQIEDLRLSSKKFMIVSGSDIKLLRIDKRKAMKDKNFQLAKKITSDIFKIEEQMAINRIEQNEKRWNIFTPEQKEKAEELRKEHYPLNRKALNRK